MKLQILKILENLNDDVFEKFKWILLDQQPNESITKHALDKATRECTVDLLVESYPGEYCGITRRVLQECGQNNMAKKMLKCEYCWRPTFGIRFGCLTLYP